MSKIFILISLALFTQSAMSRELLVVAQDFPPLNFMVEKEVKGGMADVMKEVCKKAKFDCKFEIVALARAGKLIEEGGADAFISTVNLKERESYSYFSSPIVILNLAYMGLAKNKIPKMKDLQELSGWTVVATRGGAPAKMAAKHAQAVKKLTVIEDVDNATMIQKLTGGKYETKTLIFGTEEVLKDVAEKNNVELATVLDVDKIKMIISFSKKKVSAEEAKLLNETIEALKKDGTIKKILAKYKLNMGE